MSSSGDQAKEISTKSNDKIRPASVSSFEYVSASAYEKGMQADADSNKENICPSQMEEQQPSVQKETVLTELHSIAALSETDSIDTKIKEGIDYLSKLLESKTIDRKSKKRMIRKVVLALLQAKTKHRSIFLSNKSEEIERNLEQLLVSSSASSTSSNNSTRSHAKKQFSDDGEISGVKPLSNSESDGTPPKKTEPTNEIPNKDSTMIDWLQPMTHSEIDYENHQMLNKENINAEQKKVETKLIESQAKCLEDNVDRDTHNRINWIEKEIARLVTLKINLEQQGIKPAENNGQKETADENVIYQNIKQKEKGKMQTILIFIL